MHPTWQFNEHTCLLEIFISGELSQDGLMLSESA
jgi:hypothetical protein